MYKCPDISLQNNILLLFWYKRHHRLIDRRFAFRYRVQHLILINRLVFILFSEDVSTSRAVWMLGREMSPSCRHVRRYNDICQFWSRCTTFPIYWTIPGTKDTFTFIGQEPLSAENTVIKHFTPANGAKTIRTDLKLEARPRNSIKDFRKIK